MYSLYYVIQKTSSAITFNFLYGLMFGIKEAIQPYMSYVWFPRNIYGGQPRVPVAQIDDYGIQIHHQLIIEKKKKTFVFPIIILIFCEKECKVFLKRSASSYSMYSEYCNQKNC